MARSPPKQPLIAIIGATGTGKSQLAVLLAKRFNGEIINGDAMQLYTGLPIITNKIGRDEQRGVPHHLLGCIGLNEQPWVVGTFVREALKVIQEIRSRGRLPILVGGTHYYTQSLLFHDRLAEESGGDATEERFVEDKEERWPILKEDTAVLLEELKKVDSVMSERWHPNDRRKIQRSLEVWLQTGRKASDIYTEQRERKDERRTAGGEEDDGFLQQPAGLRMPTLILWVHADKDALRDRIDHRVDIMFARGLLNEVQTLNAFAADEAAAGRSVDETRGIWVSIGYKEFKAYTAALKDANVGGEQLEKLQAEAIERTKIATRQYAKRQLRWIRIKLVNALAQTEKSNNGGDGGHMYLLDSSKLSSYSNEVLFPALELTSAFLAGEGMPNPVWLSETAAEMLVPKRDFDYAARPETWTKRHCEVCGVTCVTEEQWLAHTKSKGHRKMFRNAKKAKELEERQAGEDGEQRDSDTPGR